MGTFSAAQRDAVLDELELRRRAEPALEPFFATSTAEPFFVEPHDQGNGVAVCGCGHKMGIDATRNLPEEGHPRPWPAEMVTTREIRDLVTRRWAAQCSANSEY